MLGQQRSKFLSKKETDDLFDGTPHAPPSPDHDRSWIAYAVMFAVIGVLCIVLAIDASLTWQAFESIFQ